MATIHRSVEGVVHVNAADRLDIGSMPQPPAWTEDAICSQVDLELFFPEKGGSTRQAKQVCAQCPVSAQCLAYAVDNDERFGIWGGLSERQRRRLQRGVA